MQSNKLLGVTITKQSRENILEEIKKYIKIPRGFFHIVSLNPENLIIAREDEMFKNIIETAQIKLIDGVGVLTAGRVLGIEVGERVTGVSLVEDLMEIANVGRLRVLLIGGKPNLAVELAKCYQARLSQAKITGTEGIKNIRDPQENEEKEVFSIVTSLRPHIIFAAFGSPEQEKWIFRNRASLQGIVCMGVGGAFNYLSGGARRPPTFLRGLGFEWLFRLILEPWRWRRQLRLIQFIWLVLKEKFFLPVKFRS